MSTNFKFIIQIGLTDWAINALPNAKDYPAWKEFTLNPETLQEWRDNKTVLSDQKHLINCSITTRIACKQG